MKLAHFITHPIQYAAPLYRQIADDGRVDLTVLFGSSFGLEPSFDAGFQREIQYNIPLLGGYNCEFVRNRGSGKPDGRFSSFDFPNVREDLVRGRFNALWIHGWGYKAQWQLFRAARSLGIPYLLRAETHGGTRSSSRLRSIARRWFVRRAVLRAAGCLYIGSANRSFYRALRVRESNLFPAHYCVDVRRFCDAAEKITRPSFRTRYDTAVEQFVVLAAAKLIPRKRVDDIIRAVGLASNVLLWIVGEGPQRSELEQLASEIAPGRVRFWGFVNQSELPSLMAAADMFVLASDDEPWGLVVNEAMASGLPAVVSDRVGCAPDLVHEGETGFTYPVANVAALQARIAFLSKHPSTTKRMGESARELVLRDYDVTTTANQIANAVIAACTCKDRA